MPFFWRKLKTRDSAREKVLREFERKIKYRFKDLNLLNIALTHPSYMHEQGIRKGEHYERMEFLGDSVLGLTVCCHIYNQFPQYSEGNLSEIKSHVVSEKALTKVSERMGIGKYILLGAGEERTGGRTKSSILSNVFESILGAIYLDGGYKKAQQYILRFAADDIVVHPPDREHNNFKGLLQKESQHCFNVDPIYRLIAEDGPCHSPSFSVEVWAKDKKLGSAVGKSKKDAEQKAAKKSLKFLETEGLIKPNRRKIKKTMKL